MLTRPTVAGGPLVALLTRVTALNYLRPGWHFPVRDL